MADSPVRAGIGLNIYTWRAEPEYERAMVAFPVRGAFIITKLLQADTPQVPRGDGLPLWRQPPATRLIARGDMSRAQSLPARYFTLNRQLFGGRLPKYRFCRPAGSSVSSVGGRPAAAGVNHDHKIVFLSRVLPEDSIDRYLLHEMCHIETRTARRLHGPEWRTCMRRVGAGASWLDDEVSWYEAGSPGGFPEANGEQVVRSEMERILSSVRCQRWSEVRRHLASIGDTDEKHFDTVYPSAFAEWVNLCRRSEAVRVPDPIRR